jgi:hypothetical protein
MFKKCRGNGLAGVVHVFVRPRLMVIFIFMGLLNGHDGQNLHGSKAVRQ